MLCQQQGTVFLHQVVADDESWSGYAVGERAISKGERMLVLTFSRKSNRDDIFLLSQRGALRFKKTWWQHQHRDMQTS